MSKEYYVFPDRVSAESCLSYINSSAVFPVVGEVEGVKAESNQKTMKWASDPLEMTSGEWAIERIPASLLSYAEVTSEQIDSFMSSFGQDIRYLTSNDFI